MLREYLVADEHGRPRQGIGVDKLLAHMGRIEAECGFEEGHLERTLRRYGVVFSDDLTQRGAPPAPPESLGSTGDGSEPAPSGGDLEGRSEGDTTCPQEPSRLSLARA